MKHMRWYLGVLVYAATITLIMVRPLPFLFHHQLPFVNFLGRVTYIVLLGALMCLIRLWRGPRGVDRITATDIMGILVVGFCAVLTISTGRSWYIDIAIAWSLQNFICTLALSKYLEGKGFDE
jgi:multicomponent Na+:H+ antiporter subunit F